MRARAAENTHELVDDFVVAPGGGVVKRNHVHVVPEVWIRSRRQQHVDHLTVVLKRGGDEGRGVRAALDRVNARAPRNLDRERNGSRWAGGRLGTGPAYLLQATARH